MNPEVSQFLDDLHHPMRTEIDHLREILLSAASDLSENIKWNGPNYTHRDEDRITMRVQPITQKQIQLIFHRGAKKQEQPKEKLIEDLSGILVWKENDRAVASFRGLEEIVTHEAELLIIIQNWISASNRI